MKPLHFIYQRHGQVWVMIWTADTLNAQQSKLGEWAANDDLAFTWYDASVVAQEMRLATERQRKLDSRRNESARTEQAKTRVHRDQ